MALTVRKTGRREELDAMWQLVASGNLLSNFSTADDPAIGNGTTAGNLRTTAAVDYKIAGAAQAQLASTDDLWDLSAETDTNAASYRAYWLHADGTFAASGDKPSAAGALGDLPDPDSSKGLIGVFVAGPSTDFDDAGGLAAQGTIYDGIPAGAQIGVAGGYIAPDVVVTVPA